MPLKLIAPGTRKGNKFYLILGMEAGTQYEVSTRTADKKLAQVRLDELRAKIDGAPRAGSRITFAQATDLYLSYRSPGTREARALQRVQPVLGRKLVHEIRQADLVHAANLLYGEQTAATRNRAVMRPAGAVLHYASRNGYCPWLRIEQFKEPKPTTRAVARETADQLIAATDGAKRLLLTWLFWQGTRISDTLRVRWGEIDLEEATVKIRTHKTGKDHLFPLDEAVVALLRDVPEHRREGPVFPWSHRNSVYVWLTPLVAGLGLTFTPHMGRHSLGTWLNASGASLRTIMAALGHDSVQSSIRYQNADVEVVRKATAKIPRVRILGKTA